ncbi:MAG: glycerol-3-phosphate acyltransferase [Oscillospiraceae bacterium]|nr:glycerol-3-phosphate acyltransferase [Oscillospiraceae bacterium]
MFRVWSLLMGYVFGNFLTAELVSRRIAGKSSFERGSGNPGMANIAAQDGANSAAFVLAGDLLKTFLPCLLCRMVLFPEAGAAAAAYAGLGAILGHNFPVWHHFKGGKGVACTCAALISISLGYGLLACLIGGIGVLVSHYLSIGAVLIPAAFLLPAFCFCEKEIGIVTMIIALIMLQRNMTGLKNLLTGTEPKKYLLKKLKNNRQNID